jgi:NADPH-dependent curcumin reductase CurA
MTGKEIRFAARPRGWPTAETFEPATVDVPPPAEGDVLVRNRFMSVDPYMRGRMNDLKSYVPPFQVGKALEGAAIGEVVESRAPGLKAGDIVTSMKGWRDYFVVPAKELRLIDAPVEPLSAHLGVLGITGFTAWIGLKLVDLKPGERVFVSGAAGAVGSIAGQLAKLRGCFVVGSAGSAEKVTLVTDEFGFDAAFSYRDPSAPPPTASFGTSPANPVATPSLETGPSTPVATPSLETGSTPLAAPSLGPGGIKLRLIEAAPDGIDVYFDNVGGDHLEAAIACMRDHGRIAACGSISRYNDEAPSPGPRNMFLIVTRRLTLRGFIVTDWLHETKAFLAEVGPLVASGRLRARETIVEGLDQAPAAFLDLLRGGNVGKMIVKL